ncbi:hypothetical protein PsYK624_124140 [Phanerochaete sordida]|uniref:RNI-like protein n=1 Tax=Phanerochaete sordida TaxID=48140 RepID=A0A9P3LIC5_9APHY|nr:hypothetical protein PsYK624_124140 [Phanerochaete sordida]
MRYTLAYPVYSLLHNNPPPTPLLPNLQDLSCYDSILPFIDLVLVPSVKCLTIGSDDGVEPDLFLSITKYGPGLQELRLVDPLELDEGDEAELLPMLLSLTQLTTLKWNDLIPDDALLHLSRLPTLKNLTFCPSSDTYRSLLLNDTSAFSSLSKLVLLVLKAPLLHHTTSFLSAIHPRLLVHLEIDTDALIGRNSFTDPTNAFTAMLKSISRFHTLNELLLEFNPLVADLSGEMLSPLLGLKNLRRFHITGFNLRLALADFEAMAKAWPKLQVLHFHPRESSPDLPMDVLVPFATNCPSLLALAMPIRGPTPDMQQVERPCAPHPSLKTLVSACLSRKIENDPVAFADSLYKIFPHVKLQPQPPIPPFPMWAQRRPPGPAGSVVEAINARLETRRRES